jgi:predicted permease
VLLVGSGLLLASFDRLRSVDPGFRVDDLLTATVVLPADRYPDPDARTRFFDDLAESVEALPGVEGVAVASHLPILQGWGNYRIWNPETPPAEGTRPPYADRRVILPGYFETMGMPLLEGRALEGSDVDGSPPVVVLSRSAAERVFPGERAVSRHVAVESVEGEPRIFQVVGVVEDHRSSSLSGPVRPAMFYPYAQTPELRMRLAVAAPDPLSLVRPVQDRLREIDRNILLSDVRTMEDGLARSIAGARSISAVLGSFAIVAVVLAAVGLYGVLAFFVTRRRQEIGLRVALGATGGNVLRLVVLRGLALAALGAGLGLVGSVWATRLVAALLFETSAHDPAIFVGVTAFLLVVALASTLLPTWRALRVDPVEALRAG